MIEFEQEGFKLRTHPKYNQKARRHLGISKDEIRIIETAAGFYRKKGFRRYMQRTAAITHREFNSQTGYLTCKTENGKCFCVRYKPEDDNGLQGSTNSASV